MNKPDIIKIDVRADVLKHIKKKLDDITIADFYSEEEYNLIRKEYTEIAEMIRDKDKLLNKKQEDKFNKYFKER